MKDVIHNETSKQSERMVEEFFMAKEPAYDKCKEFFDRLNQLIRGANEHNGVTNVDTGTIPPTSYNELCQIWQQAAKKSVEDRSPEEFWSAFNRTRDLLKRFNKRHHLPQAWNIGQEWAEEMIGTPNPRTEDTESTSTSDDGQSTLTNQQATSERLSVSSDVDSDDDNQTGLDALESRTMKQQRRLTSAKVLYWWPKGTGSQIFVRYGDRNTPIYRVRAGSHESYSPHIVERVLSKTRGNAKISGTKNGLPEEFWKYKRRDVENILGIGWKIEDDDEEGLNPLSLLRPAKGASYPHTRALVKWKDGVITLEGRSFIRRISTGSALDGDRMIYQKAEELESAYRERHGLEDLGDDDYDEEDSDIEVSHGRRYRSEPARYSRSAKAKTRNRFDDSSEDSDSESDATAQNSRYRRHRSEPSRRPMRLTGRAKSTTQEDDARIKELEREIQRLKVGRSKPPKDRRRSYGRERTI